MSGQSSWSSVSAHVRKLLAAEVMRRDNRECQLRGPKCLGVATTIDHIVPASRGGSLTALENLQAACWPCNRTKSDKAPVDPGVDTPDWLL